MVIKNNALKPFLIEDGSFCKILNKPQKHSFLKIYQKLPSFNCDKNHLKSNVWCLFPPPQKITAFRQAILEIIQIWTITLPTFQCQKTQVLQLFWTQNIALTGKKQPKYSFFTYQNPKKEMELSKFIIFNKMGVFSSISIQTTLSI